MGHVTSSEVNDKSGYLLNIQIQKKIPPARASYPRGEISGPSQPFSELVLTISITIVQKALKMRIS